MPLPSAYTLYLRALPRSSNLCRALYSYCSSPSTVPIHPLPNTQRPSPRRSAPATLPCIRAPHPPQLPRSAVPSTGICRPLLHSSVPATPPYARASCPPQPPGRLPFALCSSALVTTPVHPPPSIVVVLSAGIYHPMPSVAIALHICRVVRKHLPPCTLRSYRLHSTALSSVCQPPPCTLRLPVAPTVYALCQLLPPCFAPFTALCLHWSVSCTQFGGPIKFSVKCEIWSILCLHSAVCTS
ncbi:unnamed protein product [Victoria cruziana]